MSDDDLLVTNALVIPAAELSWRFSTSGGPGGQHANTSHTRAEVSFDVAGSAVLSETQRRRLLAEIGPMATVAADDTRSQTRNRRLARERLAARLREALAPRPTRRATKPTRGSKERRLAEKQRRSRTKADRARPRHDD
ncbi:MAG: alternative ribosome rescue aminoacyl-tRNA hydrolase ArfB [Actinomycetota bacterium]